MRCAGHELTAFFEISGLIVRRFFLNGKHSSAVLKCNSQGRLSMMPKQSFTANISQELLRQQQLVDALCAPGFFPLKPRIAETHISWVLLTGRDAYKIKKAVDLGFLDFSTLELRRFYCGEELRLNRRLAPGLYLDVVAIGGSPEEPVLGPVQDPVQEKEPAAIEYAVHMRRFAESDMMDRMMARGLITPAHIDKLAAVIADFHQALPAAAADSPHCATIEIKVAAEQNFAPPRYAK
jgi:aminoglycoside phosphotransferase family enzyme